MANGDRYLLVLEKEGFAIILEFMSQQALDDYRIQVEPKGLKEIQIDLADYLSTYRGQRYFDFRNPTTREGFDLDFLLKSWELDKQHPDDHGTDEWFIH